MSYSDNAVYAKVHALYAKRLTDADYKNLLSMGSIEEIFNYLKNETSYSEYLDVLPSVTLSRSRFENVLLKSLLLRKAALCRFQKLIGDEEYRYFIKKDEIDTIIYCARHIGSDGAADLFDRPALYRKGQVISVPELQKATSFEEFTLALSNTEYGKLFEALVSESHGYKSLAALERVLFNRLYAETCEIIGKKYRGKRRREITDYIKFTSDMNIISSLYRLIENYPSDKNYQTGIFTPTVTAFTKKELEALKNAESSADVTETVKSSVYGGKFVRKFSDIDRYVQTLIINESVKNIRYSRNPVLVLFSYEAVLKNEILNIIRIIEGVKYKLSPDEISELTVKGGC